MLGRRNISDALNRRSGLKERHRAQLLIDNRDDIGLRNVLANNRPTLVHALDHVPCGSAHHALGNLRARGKAFEFFHRNLR